MKWNKYCYPVLLLIVSSVIHLIYFGHPNSVVFDEVHIGKFISWYLENSYFFDVHPPLGKMIFALFAYLFGGDITSVDFTKIGNQLPQWVIYLRLIPIFAGIALPILGYGILRKLKISQKMSFLGGLLLCFENSLIVQSRFLMTDSLILMFGFLSVYLYLHYRDNKLNKYLYLAILFSIFTFCIKWIGLSFLGLIILFEFYFNYKENGKIFSRKSIKLALLSVSSLLIIYSSLFIIHFNILTKSGNGDDYMSPSFQKGLIGSKYENDIKVNTETSFASKFVELNEEMLNANNRLKTPHQYSSAWYSWPVMYRPVYYWNATGTMSIIGTTQTMSSMSHIYYIGNPFAYWGGILAIISLIFILIKYYFNKRELEYKWPIVLILIGFIANFLPFVLIGRIMFLYHYAPALVFSIFAIIILLERMNNKKMQGISFIAVIILSISLYIFFSPLTYGTEVTDGQLQERMWLKTWR